MKRLVVVFDVTGFTDEQIDALGYEAGVQAEENEYHPDTRSTGHFIVDGPAFVIPMSRIVGVAEESLRDEFAAKAPGCVGLANDLARNAAQAIILSGTEIE